MPECIRGADRAEAGIGPRTIGAKMLNKKIPLKRPIKIPFFDCLFSMFSPPFSLFDVRNDSALFLHNPNARLIDFTDTKSR